MKKIFTLLVISFFLSTPLFSQIEDRFGALNEKNVIEYTQPFATTLGTAMNSNGYYTANIPKLFGFQIGFRGMLILIPDDQTTFTPTLQNGYTSNKTTATIYGDKGSAYAGPDGYIVTPPGINITSIPVVYPQIGASFLGIEVLLRYLPEIPLGENDKLSMFGIGVSYSISQYIPLLPVDIAAQIMYNTFTVTNLIDVSNIAFNAHASKTFGVFTPYFGLQYESTSVDLEYDITADPNSGDPAIRSGGKKTVTIDGDNNFRATLGASLQLAIIVLNADVSLSSQTVLSGGLTFSF